MPPLTLITMHLVYLVLRNAINLQSAYCKHCILDLKFFYLIIMVIPQYFKAKCLTSISDLLTFSVPSVR